MSALEHSPTKVVQFAPSVLLTKQEAFEVCEICAGAERILARAGLVVDTARMAEIFELIEGRLVSP